MRKILSTTILLFVIACSQNIMFQESYNPKNGIDERLGKFLQEVIKDKSDYEEVKSKYEGKPISFEYFIYQLYTNKIQFDTTPNNSIALAQLASYLEAERPDISNELVEELSELNLDESDMLRSMFLITLEGLVN